MPFDGKINFDKVCKKLKAIGYKGVIMLELHKKACGKPQMYENTNNQEYLKEAFKRAEKLRTMVE